MIKALRRPGIKVLVGFEVCKMLYWGSFFARTFAANRIVRAQALLRVIPLFIWNRQSLSDRCQSLIVFIFWDYYCKLWRQLLNQTVFFNTTCLKLHSLILLRLSHIWQSSLFRLVRVCISCLVIWHILLKTLCFTTRSCPLRWLLIDIDRLFLRSFLHFHLIFLCLLGSCVLKAHPHLVKALLPPLRSIWPIDAHSSLVYSDYSLWLIHLKVVVVPLLPMSDQQLLLILVASIVLTPLRWPLTKSFLSVPLARPPGCYRCRWKVWIDVSTCLLHESLVALIGYFYDCVHWDLD